MVNITMKQLLEAGVHFGHQSRRWNPKMKPYIYTERNGIYIIDLKKTLKMLRDACRFVRDAVADGKTVLFVGTKKQAKDSIYEAARDCNMFYVNNRWLGGMLTNFRTVRRSVMRLLEIERMEQDGTLQQYSKKEQAMILREKVGLEKNLAGVKKMDQLPGVLFVVDPHKEAIAVKEARKLHIPVVAIVDTNCDPDMVDWVIPGNDDAIRAVKLISQKIAESVHEGLLARADTGQPLQTELPAAPPTVDIESLERRMKYDTEEDEEEGGEIDYEAVALAEPDEEILAAKQEAEEEEEEQR
ncbi:MAG: 30S ribosomal protein S2 [Candidatus Hydrogenedentota bacterium]|uniref:Small ribosomal subunit protein uS2 n=1 Tax=Sumerlaea chitinivorans TaxID=2250252 RepID=A0A2Z4Y2I4_SUMC1|nr:SSU ribosomal protein S2p (SAe) [Candidatus Sumerlaea chitinivorans]RMH27256.1 MAG: 30S ribosomal protein S2 [Candidatus Hydrogenedentota bacterium]